MRSEEARPGKPGELAAICVQLADNQGSFATGKVYGSSGGRDIRNRPMPADIFHFRTYFSRARHKARADRCASSRAHSSR